MNEDSSYALSCPSLLINQPWFSEGELEDLEDLVWTLEWVVTYGSNLPRRMPFNKRLRRFGNTTESPPEMISEVVSLFIINSTIRSAK